MFTIEHTKPQLGKIIRGLREYRGVSQEELAQNAFFNRTTLSFIESGSHDCPSNTLSAIKSALNLDLLPLHDHERRDFREMLYRWYNCMSEHDLEAAKALREKLSIIKAIPYDVELNLLYSAFECRLLLRLGEIDSAKEILDMFEAMQDELSDIQRYHYFYNLGTYHSRFKRHERALENYLKSFELMEQGFGKSTLIYYNIAICYQKKGNISLALTFLEEALVIYPMAKSNISEYSLYNMLGSNYSISGNLQRAKIYIDKAHAIALDDKSAYGKTCLIMTYVNYGYMFRMAQKWNIAIEYFDKAIALQDKGSNDYLEAIYQKARCIIGRGSGLSSTDLLAEGTALSKDNEIYKHMFEALKLLINLNEESARQIETKIIPYLLENKVFFPVLDYATVVWDYLKTRKGTKIRALEMSNVAFTIVNKMQEGGVIV